MERFQPPQARRKPERHDKMPGEPAAFSNFRLPKLRHP
jgi:hypothetical protein